MILELEGKLNVDNDFIEYCKAEGIDYKDLDSRQIKVIKKSFSYNGYMINKSFNELLDITIKPILDKLIKLIERI
ncbi:hypothetical protein C672_3615 [[Clostridium] bifermentans ATCC 638]|uniref:Uncharacterized protein n=1 Tax=Paraclostridium bifermentans ATCC 638 = DSM 14991 TaxID=1233171 RepID=T4VG66_PARBF|nr:hypothetical protein [Paraclostridium bifermentans]EQK39751.1 hypothetical protein C672_3615 [[Clostridium] bifermentans ATCC 638] [Paraclostridium bifermentans ATCC 638 = DSM 14991]